MLTDFLWNDIPDNKLKLLVRRLDDNYIAITIGVEGNQFEYTFLKKELCETLKKALVGDKGDKFPISGAVLSIMPNPNCLGEVFIESLTLNPIARFVLNLEEDKVRDLCNLIKR